MNAGKISGTAAGNDVAVFNDFLVDELGAGIDDVAADRFPARYFSALQNSGIDQKLRTVADHENRFAALDKFFR